MTTTLASPKCSSPPSPNSAAQSPATRRTNRARRRTGQSSPHSPPAKRKGLALFAYFGSSGITILRNSLENALFGKFLGADGMMDNSVIEQIGADNLRGNIMLSQPASDTEGASYKAFAATFDSPGAPFVTHGYDIAFLAALAIEKAGSADRGLIASALRDVANAPGVFIRPGEWAKAKEALAAGEDINYEGASGAIEFDGNGDVAGIYSLNVVGDDGTWTPMN